MKMSFSMRKLYLMNSVPRNIVTSGSAGKTIQLLWEEVKALTVWFLLWSASQSDCLRPEICFEIHIKTLINFILDVEVMASLWCQIKMWNHI